MGQQNTPSDEPCADPTTTAQPVPEQTLPVPLSVGTRVTLFDDGVLFDGVVSQYNPATGLLRFDDATADIGRATFREYLDRADGIVFADP